jgi:heavy metal sensor kinase
MFFERLKGVFRTLRFRLIAWNTGVLLLIVLPALVVIREGFRRVVHNEFDRVLSEDISEISFTVAAVYPRTDDLYAELRRKAKGHAKHHLWFAQIFDEQGKLLFETGSTPQDLPELDTTRPFRLEVDTEEQPYRLVQESLKLGTGQNKREIPPLIVRIGASLRPIQEDVRLLTYTLVVVGLLIMLVAPLSGYWLSGRAIRPLARIIHKTSRLRPSNLEERLSLRGTGDELDQLSRTINGLLNRIAAYLEQKGDFLANAAHELRSPLAAIRSTVEVALNSDRPVQEYVGLLNDIMEECTSLSMLVNQLLLLAEGDAGRLALHTERVRLDQVVRKSLEMFNGVAESQGVELTGGRLEPVAVPGGENYLRQLINNLVDNALKYTPPGGKVKVEVVHEPAVGRARLLVTDTGMGIAADELPRIFERFYRSDKSRHHDGARRGTGLGLAICESIVAALQGRITVESMPGQGTTFTVYLPVASSNGVPVT